MQLADPTFPPLLRGIGVDAASGPFERACADAVAGRAGAGDTYWGQSVSEAKMAVVLEPEVPAATSLQMLTVLMVGLGDAFGSIGPPEVGMFYRWPMDLMVNNARAGNMRAGLPENAAADDVPDWLVIGLELRLMRPDGVVEPGYDLENTTLHEEGCGDIDRTRLIESAARHFLVWVHTWQEEGFRPVHDAWLPRAYGHKETVTVPLAGNEHVGEFVGVDEHAGMLLRTENGDAVALPLLDAVERF